MANCRDAGDVRVAANETSAFDEHDNCDKPAREQQHDDWARAFRAWLERRDARRFERGRSG